MNRIFLCRNTVKDEKVLLRLYGGKLLEQNNILRGGGYETEVLLFHVMDKKNIGPHLYGVFPGGRLEEFIENSNILSNEDIQNPDVVVAFARKLAQLHATQVPISKTPKDYFGLIEPIFANKWNNYIDFVKEKELPPVPEMQQALQSVYEYDFGALISWLKGLVPKIKTRIVLSHNDMNRHNCLVRHGVTDANLRVVLIDYEFTCYGYRGCDIGMHFKNRTIDVKDLMIGKMESMPYPEEADRRFFVQAYLEEARKISPDDWDESIDNEFVVLLDAEFFATIYQLFFASFIVKDFEKWKSMEMPVHPGLMFASIVRDLEDRKNKIEDLMQRGRLD